MLFASWITKIIFGTFLNEDSKFQSLLLILAVAGIGALVYGYLALKIRLAERLLGPGIARLRHKLKIK